MSISDDLQLNEIYHMDCNEGLKLIHNDSIDLIITDPPFAINFKSKRANYHRIQSRVIDGYNEISEDDYYSFTFNWMAECFRVLKDSGSLYVFSGWNNLRDILNASSKLGFITVNHLIWKYQFGLVTSRKYVTSHYHCLYLCKNEGKRFFSPYSRFSKDQKNDQGRSLHYQDKEDVWVINREYWPGDKKTPTKLPFELIEKILMYSSNPGDIILDPFHGSGQVAFVSKRLGRQYIGFEIVEDYYQFSKTRIDNDVYRIKDDD